MRPYRIACALFMLVAAIAAEPALAAEWVAARVTQPAEYSTDGGNWIDIERGMDVPNAAWIRTGSRGRVQLERDEDTILVMPNTMMVAYKVDRRGRRNAIRQEYGRIRLDLEKRNYDHMTVRTQFMAAVVKGTRFTVWTNPFRSVVSVSRGLVEVRDTRTGSKASVGAGGRAEVEKDAGRGIGLSLGSKRVGTVGGKQGASAGSAGGGKGTSASASVGGGNGVNASASVGGGSGVNASASVGGGSGVNASASVGGGNGVNASASVGGGGGVSVGVGAGGGNGVSVNVGIGGGGLGIGIGRN